MSPKHIEDPLDRMLSRPAAIADHEFSSNIHKQLQKSAKQNLKIFGVAGILWLLLAVTLASPAQLLVQVRLFLDGIVNVATGSTNVVELVRAELAQSPEIAFTPGLAVLFVLAIVGLFSYFRKLV